MDPVSFAAAFLFSQEPVTQQKLTESPGAVIAAPTEVEPEPVQAPPGLAQTGLLPGVPLDSLVVPEGNQGPSVRGEEKKQEKTGIEERHARWLERNKTPVRSCLSPPRTAPVTWRLIDRFGVTWTYSDKMYLEQFVAARNATVLVTPDVTGSGYSCSNGRCSR